MDASGSDIEEQVLLLRGINSQIGEDSGNGAVEKGDAQRIEKPLPSNPFMIEKSIRMAIGGDPRGVVITSKEARGTRYVLRVRNRQIMEKLLKMKQLVDGTAVEVIPHPSLNFCQGIVYDVDTKNVSSTEMLENLKRQGVAAVRRITKRDGEAIINTPLLVLNFHGNTLPPYVYYGLIRVPVRQYYPSPLLCFRCGKYGHSQGNCPNEKICLNCSDVHEQAEGAECRRPKKCGNCQGEHSTRDRKCPKYQEEEEIIRVKISKKISFGEARALLKKPDNQPSYSKAVQDRVKQTSEEKDREIKNLQEELQKANSMISKIQAEFQAFKARVSAVQERGKTNKESNQITEPTHVSNLTPPIIKRPIGKQQTLAKKDQRATTKNQQENR